MIHGWKKQLLDGVESLFAGGVKPDKDKAHVEAQTAELFEQIGFAPLTLLLRLA